VTLPWPELRAPEHQDCIQDRLAEEAGIQEVSRQHKLSQKKVTPHILRHSHVVNALMASVPGANRAQEALHDGDLRHCGVGPW